ncbi:MAG: 3-hydroxyacyl-CoA dehydrogenase/enoyl-CoA hydratase family protein [Chloroflexi bacterium]|nr:3-hydroxyacyl-CoA dehydrogenase/enoyl-CoA hydratase family protein [Chloroflexota bacterium]
MNRKIKRVAVLGAGVMGTAIAAHMANVGLDTYLLDMVPPELDAQDVKKGITRESPAFRNKLARTGLENALRAEPAAFYVPENARLITVGNFEDNLGYLKDVDWVIEAILEDLAIKKQLLGRIAPFLRPGTIISTNTSGLSVNKIAEGLNAEHRPNFLGTHFFNPPRYMKLMEIVPADATVPEVVQFIADFCERRLGKGVVFARDAPNFIANRIGMHNVIATIKAMLAGGYTIEEVDAITGTPLGRPRSATFRTLDVVGLDTFYHVTMNFLESMADETEKEGYQLPDFVTRMVKEGFVGEKKGRGFYKRERTAEGPQIYSLDYNTFEYMPQREAKFPILDNLKRVTDTGSRIKTLVNSDDRAGRFAWQVTKRLLLYSAAKIPEVAEDIVNVDRAIKWGFNHELGPFEVWDAIGVRESIERMTKEGETVPENVLQMLRLGKDLFYLRRDGKTYYYDFRTADYIEIAEKPRIILLPSLKERKKLIKANAGASLIDIGEGVACLEFHSPNNAVGADIVEMINYSISEVASNYEGLVIGNHGTNFCVGANLMLILMAAQSQDWDEVDFMVRQFQAATRNIRFSEKPVVAAPFRMTLGAGCEICLAASRVRAAAETYVGLVEVGAGLVPAGGGCKEMLVRSIDGIPAAVPSAMPGGSQPGLIPFVSKAFETIATAKVATSARDAQKIGYLAPQDKITFNQDHLLHDAKETVLALAREGYMPPRPRDDIRVTGRTGYATLEAIIYNMKEGAFISEHDALIARKVATILTGGDLPQNTLVTEDYLLDLERENFLSLCGEAKSQARMRAMLQTGRPLRN